MPTNIDNSTSNATTNTNISNNNNGYNIDKLRLVTIEEIIQETPTVKTLVFKDSYSFNAKPGQFLMVWIPRVEEIPMSIMVSDKHEYAAVTVRKYGFGSSALFNKSIGDVIGIRGPYGNYFIVGENKKVLVVGGGTGLVPLVRLAIQLNKLKINTTVIIGARTLKEVFFEEQMKNILSNTDSRVIVTTEDGSYGFKGYATDALESITEKERFDCIFTCGPELMMKKIAGLSKRYSIPLQASLERYMKCGIGICASCCIGDKLVCRDGTVFNQEQLNNMPEFGNTYRNKSGQKVSF